MPPFFPRVRQLRVPRAPAMPPAPVVDASAARRTPRWWLITPLFFTALPLLRHAMRKSAPARRHMAYGVAVGAGLLHGFSTMLWAADAPPSEDDVYFSPAQLAARAAADRQR